MAESIGTGESMIESKPSSPDLSRVSDRGSLLAINEELKGVFLALEIGRLLSDKDTTRSELFESVTVDTFENIFSNAQTLREGVKSAEDSALTAFVINMNKVFSFRENTAIESTAVLDENFRRMSNFLIGSIIHPNLNKFKDHLKATKDLTGRKNLIRLISNVAKYGNNVQKEDAVDFFASSLVMLYFDRSSFLKELGRESIYASGFVEALAAVVGQSNPDQFKKGSGILDFVNFAKLHEPELKILLDHGMPLYFTEKDLTSGIVKDTLSKYGLDAKEMVRKWRLSHKYLPDRAVNLNIAKILNLEDKVPGITSILNSEFGIYDFARYPDEILIAQYNQISNKDIPYGIIVNPESDHNGAFYHDLKTFSELFRQLKGEYGIRVYEVEDTQGLVGVLNSSRKRFGKISFAIIGGHGTTSSIQLGESTERNSKISQKDLVRPGSAALSLAFINDPTIILNSCSTGQLGGIGQEISRIGAKVVIGPDKPTGLKSIRAKVESGKVYFKVRYRKSGKNEYSAGIKA